MTRKRQKYDDHLAGAQQGSVRFQGQQSQGLLSPGPPPLGSWTPQHAHNSTVGSPDPSRQHPPGQQPYPAVPPQGQWSEEEYLDLETNRLVEFSDGFLEVLPVPKTSHQLLVAYLYGLLLPFVTAHDLWTVLFAPLRMPDGPCPPLLVGIRHNSNSRRFLCPPDGSCLQGWRMPTRGVVANA